jgi:hypothetical protein
MNQEEGTMIFSGKDFQVYHLGSVAVSYPPRSINTQAIQVTPQNIGALSLEFKVGLHYSTDGSPYIKIHVEREPFTSGPKRTVELMIFVDDWIVVLWDELHIFQDVEFKNTFHIIAVEMAEHRLIPSLPSIDTPDPVQTDVQPGNLAFDHDEVAPR